MSVWFWEQKATCLLTLGGVQLGKKTKQLMGCVCVAVLKPYNGFISVKIPSPFWGHLYLSIAYPQTDNRCRYPPTSCKCCALCLDALPSLPSNSPSQYGFPCPLCKSVPSPWTSSVLFFPQWISPILIQYELHLVYCLFPALEGKSWEGEDFYLLAQCYIPSA